MDDLRLGLWELPTDPAVTGLVLRALSADPLDAGVVGDCAQVRAAG